MERRLILAAACAFIIAAVLFSAWAPGQFATPGVDRVNGYVSELAARDQPWSPLFRTTDALAGLACLLGIAVLPVARGDGRTGARGPWRWEQAGWPALALFGLLTIADAAFPLDCAALSDPACERGPLSFSHHAHAVLSVLAVLAVLAAMALLSPPSRMSWALTTTMAAVTLLLLAAIAAGRLAGVAQRAQVTIVAIWLVHLALRLLSQEAVRPVAHLHVIDQGEGPAVVITDGMAGAWYHWDRVAAALAATHRVIRFDRPGLGRSTAALTTPTLYGEAARLAALAPPHPEHVTVVAHSVAAWHAEAFARLHPLRIRALVLVDPSPLPRRERRTSAAGRAIGRWLPALGGTWGAGAIARLAGPAVHRMVTGVADVPGVYREGQVLAAAAGEWLAFRDMAADLRQIRREHAFPHVPVTVLSAGGSRRRHEELAGLLEARLVRLPGFGHQVQVTAPEVIIQAV
ncbi:alpha/beta fold hydrolase [Nonomuraea sediminis]|uniref:alpha/beta fold hydrolase n=1 Tax=Nonomuraea sediminis TaxID=2835864 RepID=UPI001BDD1FB7|nr:alpha/beta fold hydrolase [Nonomuraea sediminis]